VELTVDISTDSDRGSDGLNVGLIDKNLLGLLAESFDGFLGEGFAF